MFTAALLTIVKRYKQPKCLSTEEWINKMWYVPIMEYFIAIKKILSHVTIWIDIQDIMQRKISQIEG